MGLRVDTEKRNRELGSRREKVRQIESEALSLSENHLSFDEGLRAFVSGRAEFRHNYRAFIRDYKLISEAKSGSDSPENDNRG